MVKRSIMAVTLSLALILSLCLVTAAPAAAADTTVFQAGGDRLVELQNDDGGWDWPLDNGNPLTGSAPNTIGPIGMGLAQAYMVTGDLDQLAALSKVKTFLLAKTNNFSPSDGYLAVVLDDVLGGTACTDHVIANFYGPLAGGTYDRNGSGTLYNTAGYVQLIRDARAGQGIANLAAWDIGMGLVGAAMIGADTTAWVDGVKAEIDELDGDEYYDVIGLAGAVYGLAVADEDFDPTAGEHAAASSLEDMADILVGYQLTTGGFTWSSNYVVEGDDNETIQETAYAVLALQEMGDYEAEASAAEQYIASVQLGTGGWKNWAGEGENNEVTGEALWALNTNPIADANGPYLVQVGSSITLDGSASYDPNGDALTFTWTVDGGILNDNIPVTPEYTAGIEVGVYTVSLKVSDGIYSDTASTSIVVYDPSAGFVTGGGWINSPANEDYQYMQVSGKATFGFVAKYNKKTESAEGNTEFVFTAGDLNFHSTCYNWLIINEADSRAQFKGTGAINGTGEYKFMLWADDGEPDTFRIKIWEEDNLGNETVVYDNGSDQPISGGSIIVHTSKK